YGIFRSADAVVGPEPEPDSSTAAPYPTKPLDPARELTRCFLRLVNLPSCALDRLSRYEATLWRQAGRILFALDALDRRKPQDRGRRIGLRSWRGPPIVEGDEH